MTKKIVCCLLAVALLGSLASCGAGKPKLYVFNFGDYMARGQDKGIQNVNKIFEERYGVKIKYAEYANNENMYSKVKKGGAYYDVVFPSDYMIERMITEDMLAPLNFDNIPNYKYIDAQYKNLDFDPDNAYSVPYFAGIIGLIYNKTMVKAAPDSWAALWDEDYKGKICMINNPRDAFGIAQSLLGQDCNSQDSTNWEAAAQKLLEQKPLVQSYVDDEVYSKMEPGEAALAPYYVGDYLLMIEANPNLEFVYPKEGVNFFVDSICVLKSSQSKDLAEQYINFLMEPEIALENAEYIRYASPHMEVINNKDYTYYKNKLLYPTADIMPQTTIFRNLPPDILDLMNRRWDDVKSQSKK